MPFWVDDAIARVRAGDIVVNDSKTPSGRAHVGALRGVLVHDAIHRMALASGRSSTYLFGCDDYDPLDEIPFGMTEYYGPHLGKPLCDVPPPPGSDRSDIADHFISEFFGLFERLGVDATTYRMRDHYRSGLFDSAIDILLRNRQKVRDIYRVVSGSIKPDDWYPLQVVCERCGKIGTTLVTDYDGELVTYECKEDLVDWARGCAFVSRVSPFGGAAKLPWKLEWASKWYLLGITVEGAGKDHNTLGGSRDVADAVAREIFKIDPPFNIKYEFFLVNGSKMSSSKGLGVAAADMVDLLPPELIRFLLIRTPPKTALNFDPSVQTIARLFSEFDSLLEPGKVAFPGRLRPLVSIDRCAELTVTPRLSRIIPWDVLVGLRQLSHLDTAELIARRFDPALSPAEALHLEQRIQTADKWLAAFAPDSKGLSLRPLDGSNPAWRVDQRIFISDLRDALANIGWNADTIHSAVFATARAVPINPGLAFEALYQAILGRNEGPRAGTFLAFLDRTEVLARLPAYEAGPRERWEATARPLDDFEAALAATRRRSDEPYRVLLTFRFDAVEVPRHEGHGTIEEPVVDGVGIIDAELLIANQPHLIRGSLMRFRSISSTADAEREHARDLFDKYVEELCAGVLSDVDVTKSESV